MKSQKDIVLRHLKEHGSINQWEAINWYGFTRLSAIIFNLKHDGYVIKSVLKDTVNRYGRHVKYTEYTLLEGNNNVEK